jgi:hypothetical protein
MTFLSVPQLGGGNKTMANPNHAGFNSKASRRRAGAINVGYSEPKQTIVDPTALEIEKMVREGRQNDITAFFDKWRDIPSRIGDWNLKVNVRRVDNVVVGRTIVALPLTVRTRAIFEQGRLTVLKAAGYTSEEAARYYKAAWKKQYVWVDTVIAAVKEMIDAFQNERVLTSYELAGDPRRLAANTGVPRNPYLVSHAHFLVAVEMAKCIIKARQAGEEVNAQQDKPEAATSNMVAA